MTDLSERFAGMTPGELADMGFTLKAQEDVNRVALIEQLMCEEDGMERVAKFIQADEAHEDNWLEAIDNAVAETTLDDERAEVLRNIVREKIADYYGQLIPDQPGSEEYWLGEIDRSVEAGRLDPARAEQLRKIARDMIADHYEQLISNQPGSGDYWLGEIDRSLEAGKLDADQAEKLREIVRRMQ